MAEKLLQEKFWREDEMQELRNIRDAAVQRQQSGPLDELERSFGPDRIEDAGNGRVRMFFDLKKQHGGALAQGSWILNVTGWSPPFAARNDEDLLGRAGPSLALEPLRCEKEPLDLTLQLEQPADQPPRVLLVSAAGFQIGFLGSLQGGKARWLAGSRSAADLLAELRKGAGTEFEGWKAGANLSLQLTLTHSGVVLVKRNGTTLGRMSLPAPRSEGPPSFSVRAWECLRLVSLTVEAAHP
jgi:hypothetical protein